MRCKNCVLEENPNFARLDDQGVCSQCRSYSSPPYWGEEEFSKIIENAKKQARERGSKYDCAVTVSGGRDSTYTLVKLVKDYHARVLAINYENPFTDPQAKANIQNAVKKLGVDLVQFKLPHSIHERTFQNNLKVWLKRPSPAMVPIICVACKTIWYRILKIAKENDITCIVSGGNRFEDTSFKKELLHIKAGNDPGSTFTKAIFGVLAGFVHNPGYVRGRFIPTLLKGYLFGDPYTIGSRLMGRKVQRVDLFFYIPWNEQEVLSRIKSEVGWDYPKNMGTWRFDCKVDHMKDVMYLITLGMVPKADFYSKMIREKLIDREEALNRLANEDLVNWDLIKELTQAAGIDDISDIQRKASGYLVPPPQPQGAEITPSPIVALGISKQMR